MAEEKLPFFSFPGLPSTEGGNTALANTFNELETTLGADNDLSKLGDKLTVDQSTTEESKEYEQWADALAGYVKEQFQISESARKYLEFDWVKALKQYKGIYEQEILGRISPNRSHAFVRVTRTKVKTVDSRLCDLLFPANGEKNWEVTATPVPDMSERKKQAIIQLYEQESGQKITPAKLDSLLCEEACRQARKMSNTINDQLGELKYREIMREVIHSGNVYGTGILKGPLVALRENQQYAKVRDEDGAEQWLLRDFDRIIPFAESVRIWDFYPDMEATSIKDCRYIIQRRKMNKQDLISLSKRQDFSSDVITKYLKMFPEGVYDKKAFEIELQTMGDMVTPSNSSQARKYEVLEYWGYVDTKTLADWGMEIPENKQNWLEIPCNVWVLGNKVIKAATSPLEGIKWPFYIYYFDKDETSIFGEGIPGVMKTMQEMTNSAFRAMLDNAAISAGPQIEVNLDLLSEDEDPREVHPFKVWMRTGQGVDASNPCIRSITMPSYTIEFERMLTLFGNYSDEITTIPRYMWGDTSNAQGAGRTSSGLSMLMGSANMAIKDQVKNFDDGITSPFIKAMYHWNMQFNPDEDIKGDYSVVARGSASLIAKEMYTQYLIQFLGMTANPMDASIVKRPNVIRSIADAFDLKSETFVLNDAEIKAQRQAQQEQHTREQEFMYNMVEAARENGVSPESLVTSMRQLLQGVDTGAVN